jgi:hypothetical protein
MKVSFDFDNTLTKQSIQKYAKSLIRKGIEVWIVTSRCDNWKYVYGNGYDKYDNSDLFSMADKLGIKQEHIIFTNANYKSEFLSDDFIFHVDDDKSELAQIKHIPVVDVNSKHSVRQCNKILEEVYGYEKETL